MVPRKRPLATWLRFSGVGNFRTYVFLRGGDWRLRGLSLFSFYKYGKNRRRVPRNWSWQGNLASEGKKCGQMLKGPCKGEKDAGRNNGLKHKGSCVMKAFFPFGDDSCLRFRWSTNSKKKKKREHDGQFFLLNVNWRFWGSSRSRAPWSASVWII